MPTSTMVPDVRLRNATLIAWLMWATKTTPGRTYTIATEQRGCMSWHEVF